MRVISNHQYKILLEIQPFKLMIMKKLSVVCLCFLLVNITTAVVYAEDTWDCESLFSLSVDNVLSFYADPDSERFYFHTIDTMYVTDFDGDIISKTNSPIRYAVFDEEEFYYFYFDEFAIIDTFGDTIVDLRQHLIKNVYDYPKDDLYRVDTLSARFIAKGDSCFYIFIRNHPIWDSYSDHIRMLGMDGETSSLVLYGSSLTGIYCLDGLIYYTMPKPGFVNTSFLITSSPFNYTTSMPSHKKIYEEIPVGNPVGLYIFDDYYYTFSNESKEMIRLSKGFSDVEKVNFDDFSVSVEDGVMFLFGVPIDDIITVFTSSGQIVYCGTGRGVVLPGSGLYIVKVNEFTRKVVLK